MRKLDLLLVSGSTRGIGRAIVDGCYDTANKIIGIGSELHIRKDLSNYIGVGIDLINTDAIFGELENTISRISLKRIGVVLCASQLGDFGGILNSNLNNWIDTYKINVIGNIAILQYLVKRLDKSASIRVVFLAGGGAAYGYPEFSGYSLSKVATVRAVENISLEFEKNNINGSIIALAPGAVSTDMLKKVIKYGGKINTKTNISESVLFAKNFILDNFNCKLLNGRFLHVRDNLSESTNIESNSNHFKLRRIE